MYRKFLLPFLLLFALAAQSQQAYTPSPENLRAREWFQDARFGMFIHWGVYSVLGDGEWVQNNQSIDKATYQKLPAFFNPISFNPAEWVALAKAAGMKYITITSKHHDGFAMFDSKLTDWDIIDRTPYRKDVLKMLADECRKEGIKLFFYHSQLDWYQDNYFPRGNTGRTAGRPEKGDWYKYLDFMADEINHFFQIFGIQACGKFPGARLLPAADAAGRMVSQAGFGADAFSNSPHQPELPENIIAQVYR